MLADAPGVDHFVYDGEGSAMGIVCDGGQRPACARGGLERGGTCRGLGEQ